MRKGQYKGYITSEDIRNATDIDFGHKKPRYSDIDLPAYVSLEDSYPERFLPDTTWIWQLDEMVEVEVIERSRKVFLKRDEENEPVYTYESFTTHKIPPNPKRWDKNGKLIVEASAQKDNQLSIDKKEDTIEYKQLSLFR